MRKLLEKEVANVFLSVYNKNNKVNYEIDESYLENRKDFPDIKLISRGEPVKDLQIEVTGLYLLRQSVVQNSLFGFIISNKLKAIPIDKIRLQINDFVLPDKKDQDIFIDHVIDMVKHFNDTSRPIKIYLKEKSISDKWPTLKKYCSEIIIGQSNSIDIAVGSKIIEAPLNPIASAIKAKEEHYTKEQKAKTILLLHDESFRNVGGIPEIARQHYVSRFIKEADTSSLTFKQIWWIDCTTKNCIKIK